MAIYANKLSKECIPGSNIEEKILKEHLVPSNINRGKEVDNIVLSMLCRTHPCSSMDVIYQRSQKKNLNAMGPLSTIWTGLENIKKTSNETIEVTNKPTHQFCGENNAINWIGIPFSDIPETTCYPVEFIERVLISEAGSQGEGSIITR